MKITWVISDSMVADPLLDTAQLKNIGSIWGSWRTWRSFSTDNVICHEIKKAQELVKRNFQSLCNFYISNSIYTALDKPIGVKVYEGDFVHDVDQREDIIAMHLAATVSDIVLLIGFDLSLPGADADKITLHKKRNYRSLFKQVIKDNNRVQWVMIGPSLAGVDDFGQINNLTYDSLENILATPF